MNAIGGSRLKASILGPEKLWAWLAAVTVAVVVGGCSEDSQDGTDVGVGSVEISTIILKPKTASPGDTIWATAVVSGTATAGNYPEVEWSATGGEFLKSNAMSVDWIAPDSSGVYRLTCRAGGGESSDEKFIDVFVGAPELSVNQNAGEIRLTATQGEFYYLHSIPRFESWDSSSVYIQSTGVPAPVVPGERVGAQFTFSSSLAYAAYVVNSGGPYTLKPLDVYVVDLAGGTERKITMDRAAPSSQRRQRYSRPYFSPDQNWITYQGLLPNPQAGNVDTLDVFTYNLLTDQETNVTEVDVKIAARKNLFPTYGTDFGWLVYVSNRGRQNQWDLFGVPLSGGAVDGPIQQLTTGGLIGLSAMESLGRPKLSWNPSQPVLAVVGAAGSDGGLHLVATTAQGANTTDVPELGDEVQTFAWSADGQMLAVSAVVTSTDGVSKQNALFTVTPTGTPTERHRARVNDGILDLGWSPDGKFLVFRLVRRGESWIELVDIDGGTNYPAPLAVTKAAPDGMRAAYSEEMSTASRYGSGDNVYFLLFDPELAGNSSPTIWTLDVSAAVQP
jgi:Tol biopolymer transport system component